MSHRSLEVCVVGAGPSGLVAIKELLDEGHRVVCFEEQAASGGVFNELGRHRYGSFRLTVSQHFMTFSSLRPPLDEPRRFWTRTEYADYLNRFAATFGLLAHIRFDTRVISVRPRKGGSVDVFYEHGGQRWRRGFDSVALCQGAFRPSAPNMPIFEGQESFGGEILHSSSYRGPEPYRNRRVVCVGLGETSADIVREISAVTEACWLSMRSRPALVPRYPFGGEHTADAYSSRLNHWIPAGFAPPPDPVETSVVKQIQRDASTLERQASSSLGTLVSERLRLISEWNAGADSLWKPLQKNDDFIDNVLSGAIRVVHAGVRQLDGNTVQFMDGSSAVADSVLCCTGYDESSIPREWLPDVAVDDVRRLFKHAFHPDLGPRVAWIGWARPHQGGVPACSEMVARYFSLLCSGSRSLPPRKDLLATIDRDDARESRQARKTRTAVDYTRYMDDLAALVGCQPELADYLDQPEFLYRLVCGSNIASCYRLRGPHADPEGARRAILALPVANTAATIRQRLPSALRARLDAALADRTLAVLYQNLGGKE